MTPLLKNLLTRRLSDRMDKFLTEAALSDADKAALRTSLGAQSQLVAKDISDALGSIPVSASFGGVPISQSISVSGSLTSDGVTPVIFPDLYYTGSIHYPYVSGTPYSGSYPFFIQYHSGSRSYRLYAGSAFWGSSSLARPFIPTGETTGTAILTVSAGTPGTLGQEVIVSPSDIYKCMEVDPMLWVNLLPVIPLCYNLAPAGPYEDNDTAINHGVPIGALYFDVSNYVKIVVPIE